MTTTHTDNRQLSPPGRPPPLGGGLPGLLFADTFAQSSYTRWSVSLYNTAGQPTATRVYHAIPASGDGSSGTNYDESTFGYDTMGRQNKSTTPGGTIRRTVFDARGHAVADYVGTNDSSATDADPTGAGGDPHLVICTGSSPLSSSSSSSSSSTTRDRHQHAEAGGDLPRFG